MSVVLTLVGVVAIAVPSLATASAVTVNTSPDSIEKFTPSQNETSGWPDCAGGLKVDLDGQGKYTYTLTSPASLLVLKAATWNFIWNNPSAGVCTAFPRRPTARSTRCLT